MSDAPEEYRSDAGTVSGGNDNHGIDSDSGSMRTFVPTPQCYGRRMQVAVLVMNGVFDTGLSVVLDTLETANSLAAENRRFEPFDLTLCGLGKTARTHHGLDVALARADRLPRPDLVIVPALGAKSVPEISAALERKDVIDNAELLASWRAAGVRVAGACTATFVLAASGILDGDAATTTWWLSPLFRERFPGVHLDESRMIVESKSAVTAGAALAHVDLALFFVRKRSPSLAHATARYLVFDARPSHAQYVMPDHLAHDDPLVRKFERFARSHLADFSLERAARHLGASERTLERRLRAVLGRTPVAYVQDLRVELAIHRLRTTKLTIDEIAESVGYENGATLRALLRKSTGRGVRELRAMG
jgi:transcriptional regulator GlxA family with amidase domain